MHPDCLFCKIITGDIPSYKVYEDDTVLAFLDIFPVRAGHVLVVPKKHVDEFQDMDDATYQAVMMQVRTLARRMKEVYQPQRVGMMVMGCPACTHTRYAYGREG
jgi:histidine triad (HIT) family protein